MQIVSSRESGKIFEIRRSMWAVLGLGVFVRLVDIGYQSYSVDELWELSIVHLPAGEILSIGDGFPPLFHLIFRAFIVGGLSDGAGRAIAVVAGIATVWLAGRLGRRFSPAVEIGTALAVALAPLLVLLSKEGRAYGLYVLAAGLLMLATWDVVETNSGRAWAVFVTAILFGLYTHYMFVLAAVSAETVILLNRRTLGSIRPWLISHTALLVLLVPLLLASTADLELDAASLDARVGSLSAIGYAGFSLFTGFTLGPSTRDLHEMATSEALSDALPWAIPIALAAGYLGFGGWRGMSRKWRINLLTPIVVPLSLLSVLSFTIGTAFRVRYLAWLVLPVALWLSIGYSMTPGNTKNIAAVTLAGIAVVAMIGRLTISDHQVEDARGVAAYIADNDQRSTIAMVWYIARPVEYYLNPVNATMLPDGDKRFSYHELPENNIVPLPSARPGESTLDDALRVFSQTVAVGENYRLVYSREFHGDVDREFLTQRIVADGLEDVAEFAGITIYEGRRAS